MHKGQFGDRNSSINGADEAGECLVVWADKRSVTTNTVQPARINCGPGWNSY